MNVRSFSTWAADPVAAEIWVCDVCGQLANDCTSHPETRNLVLFQFHTAWLLDQIHTPASTREQKP